MRRNGILILPLAWGLTACAPSPTPTASSQPPGDVTLAATPSATVIATEASPTPLPSPTESATVTPSPTPTPTTEPISPANIDHLSQVIWRIVARSPSLSHDGRLLAFAACDGDEALHPSCSSDRYTTLQI